MPDITITEEKVKEMEKEISRLEEEIREREQRKLLLQGILRELPRLAGGHTLKTTDIGKVPSAPEVILHILRAQERPLTATGIKKKLREEEPFGFTPKIYTSSFYILIISK